MPNSCQELQPKKARFARNGKKKGELARKKKPEQLLERKSVLTRDPRKTTSRDKTQSSPLGEGFKKRKIAQGKGLWREFTQ